MPAAGRRPGNATEDHEGAGQRPALPEYHALLRQAMPGGRERAAAAVLRRAAEDRNTVVPAAGRQPGNATEDHEDAGQRPALPEYHELLRQATPGGRERVAAAVLWRAAEDRNTVVPAAGRQPGNATEDHEDAGQRPALPEYHTLLRQATPGGRERAAAAVLWRAAKDRNTVVPAAGRQPGNATEDHEGAGQRPALPIAKVYGPGGKRTSKRAPPSSLERPTASSPR
ncbi:hypothetical protein AL480_19355 [Stenotrophomonas maltophilia]|nr:hypothetical protein AL480_19355 [Stenotrophomonas maltophilia]